ncbi:hypothetical protein Patl1_35089 [Pistacia atlantica]|uniref:Uncharacterized protein n=1 Tax=Pistacia atlantica TaxID=434234 RepID=A0ACC0ZUV7_9ROSI|nr:hypothetical protein Patl1_35089 [Pistacia atlantica]
MAPTKRPRDIEAAAKGKKKAAARPSYRIQHFHLTQAGVDNTQPQFQFLMYPEGFEPDVPDYMPDEE